MANPDRADRRWLPVLICAGLLAAALVVTPMIGSASLDLYQVWTGEPTQSAIFWMRVSRVLLAALAGGALAMAGTLFQALVRDSLADPYTLGISSGAALGAVLALCFRWQDYLGLPAVTATAVAGSFLVLLIVLALASRGRRLSSFTLLLAGVTVNSMSIAAILFLHSVADFSQSFAMMRWLMGGIEPPDVPVLAVVAAVVITLAGFAISQARHWNLIAVGEQWAEARGVSAQRTLRIGFFVASLLTATVTSMTGPVGFLGWLVPHALRLRLGADHRVLLPCAFLGGAAFLPVCDTVARTILSPAEIPVGAITALTAGPFFLWLLGSRRRSLWL